MQGGGIAYAFGMIAIVAVLFMFATDTFREDTFKENEPTCQQMCRENNAQYITVEVKLTGQDLCYCQMQDGSVQYAPVGN